MKFFAQVRMSRPESNVCSTCWSPAADIYRAPWGWLVKFDLAEVRLEDVRLTVQGEHMTLSGTRRDTVSEEGCCHYLLEINYSHFERTLEFPCNLERAQISTELREGMLLVRVNMMEAAP